MPHQCTDCGRTFADGSKEMLSGCPDCGNNQFQYIPKGDAEPAAESPPERPGDSGVAGTVNKATTTVREWVSGGSDDQTDDDRARSGWSDVASDVASEGRDDPATQTSTPPPETTPSDFASDDESTATGGSDHMDDAASPSETTARSNETTASSSETATGSTDESDRSDDRAYGEWPNPDGADTSGVGKGPGVRRDPDDPSPDERPTSDTSPNERSSDDTSPTETSAPERAGAEDERPTASTDSTANSSTDSTANSSADSTADPDSHRTRAKIEMDEEDSAQADARSAVVSPDEIAQGADADPTDDDRSADAQSPDAASPDPENGRVVGTPGDGDRPDLAQLREELNDQFESIKIVSPGTYELNLMELYDRNEYIISLQEDGRYVIEVPEAWRDDDDD